VKFILLYKFKNSLPVGMAQCTRAAAPVVRSNWHHLNAGDEQVYYTVLVFCTATPSSAY
jgi:hypothetical protein